MSPSIAPTWIDPRFRRNFTALLGPNETWSPTFAPTVTLADSEVLTAMTDAISSLSAAQLSSAVAGEAAAVINTANVMMSSGRAVHFNPPRFVSTPLTRLLHGGRTAADASGSAPHLANGGGSWRPRLASVRGRSQRMALTSPMMRRLTRSFSNTEPTFSRTDSPHRHRTSLISLGVSTVETDEDGQPVADGSLVSRRRPRHGQDDEPLTIDAEHRH